LVLDGLVQNQSQDWTGLNRTINIPNYNTKGKPLTKHIIEHIKQAQIDGFKIIIMGDYNTDPNTYLNLLAQGRSIPQSLLLIEFLYNNNYLEQSAKNEANLEFASHYVGTTPTSRIDLIWYPEEFLSNEHCFDRTWQLPFTMLSSDNSHNLDHMCVTVFFTKSLLIGDLPVHRMKQKKEWRSFYDVKNATKEQWSSFKEHLDEHLLTNEHSTEYNIAKSNTFNQSIFNRRWHISKAHILVRRVSPYIYHKHCDDEALIVYRLQHSTLNEIFAFLTSTINIYSTNMPIHKAQKLWTGNRDLSFRSLLFNINKKHNHLIPTDSIPIMINHSNLSDFKILRTKVAALRNTIKKLRDFKESQLKATRIRSYKQIRCSNFANHKATFISSALNRSKRAIILDRAMITNNEGEQILIVDPDNVKTATNLHFKTIAGSAPSIIHTLDSMNHKWCTVYMSISSINDSIYSQLLSDITDEEWTSAIKSLPSNKAAGISQITYEMLKHLPNSSSNYLRELINECFKSSSIPSIPKPHKWNCYLKNTRPITLLDTARKLMTRILYNRIAVLAKNSIMTGGNYAGLPGGSCDPPITVLEAIINDANKQNKPLFILQQDIKSF
jgi:hypothetical protein